MNKRFLSAVAGFSLMVISLAFPTQVLATGKELIAKVPFEFVVGDQTLPAGTYRIELASPRMITVHSTATKDSATTPVITRLARETHVGHDKDMSLVFDDVDYKQYLSEVWFAAQDGCLIRGTPEEHTHKLITPKE